MFLLRPELTEKILHAAVAHSLTAVVAPMGYGKTTLAHAVAEKLPRVYYYAVPAGPHDGHFVWHDMCAAFEAQGLGIAPALWRLGLPESASQARQALDLLCSLGARDAPACLILDDYHYVSDPLLDAFWERMVRESIPNLHLILLSRAIPKVNLEELCLKGYATQFEQDLLTFSQEETIAFFQANGIENLAAAVESQHYSEGWPAVLWLCLQSWQKNGRIVASGSIDSLLANAVFAAYSPEEQNFLLRLSVFESFREEDAEKITAESGWLPVSLIELRQKNALLSFDAKTICYQFHSIFREFLRKRLAATAHIDKPSLYRMAGECCFARRDRVSAFRLFFQAGRDDDLCRLLDVFKCFAEDRNLFFFAEECFQAASTVPWRVRLQNPLGWLAFVGLHTLMWKDPRTVALLDETEKCFPVAVEIPESMQKHLQGEIELVRAYLAFNNPDSMLFHYTEAVRHLNGPSFFVSEDFPWNCGSPHLSFAVVREPGTYGMLPERGAQLLRLYNILSAGKAQNYENILQLEYLLERGEFSRAEPFLMDVRRKCGSDIRQQMGALISVFGLARFFVVNGHAENALSGFEALRPCLEAQDLLYLFDGFDVALGYINAVLGRYDAIPRWLRDGEMLDPPHDVMPHIFGISLTVYGKALLLQGEYTKAARLAEDIPDAAPLVYLFARIHSKILQAVAVWHTQGQSEALALLRKALDLSRPDGIMLSIAEYGGHILPLLRRLKRDSSDDPHLDAVLALAERIARIATSPKVQKNALTPREQEIMRHVANGETNPAIAADLHISINTVKYLLSKAYAKLGAFNRLDAAQRFEELRDKPQD